MAKKYLDYNGVLYFWSKIKTILGNKVDTNATITAGTKTKVTYDAKGLVTGGDDATTADIADSTNKRYVTDAQKTVLGNTSGTNSGNETAASIGTLINGADVKTTPADEDMVGLMDSAAANAVKKFSWANIKATLKTYFDTLYAAASHNHTGTYQPIDADLTAIAGLAGTSGGLKKTAADIWELDTNSYVVANVAVTAATKAKVTYDTKGLITGGADLVAGDIPDLSGTYVVAAQKGLASGICPLGSDSLIPSQYLPSFVDDVMELDAVQTQAGAAPATCSTGDKYYNYTNAVIYTATGPNTWGGVGVAPVGDKIYVDKTNNNSFRWGGSQMVLITSSDMVTILNGEIDTIIAS